LRRLLKIDWFWVGRWSGHRIPTAEYGQLCGADTRIKSFTDLYSKAMVAVCLLTRQ